LHRSLLGGVPGRLLAGILDGLALPGHACRSTCFVRFANMHACANVQEVVDLDGKCFSKVPSPTPLPQHPNHSTKPQHQPWQSSKGTLLNSGLTCTTDPVPQHQTCQSTHLWPSCYTSFALCNWAALPAVLPLTVQHCRLPACTACTRQWTVTELLSCVSSLRNAAVQGLRSDRRQEGDNYRCRPDLRQGRRLMLHSAVCQPPWGKLAVLRDSCSCCWLP
jgi:hypothetical protein